MIRKNYILITQVILLLTYTLFLHHATFITHFIPTIFYGIVAYVLFKRSKNPSLLQKPWFFLGFLPLSLCVISFIHFTFVHILNKKDIGHLFSYNLYALPNLLLLFSVIVFFVLFSKIKHWHRTRFLMDIFIILIILTVYATPHFRVAFAPGFTGFWPLMLSSTYLIPSLLMVILVLVLLISFNKKDFSITILFLLLGFFTYHFGSLLAIGFPFPQLVIPSEYLSLIYMFSLFFFFLAGFLKNNNPATNNPISNNNIPVNFNQSYIIVIIGLAITTCFLLLVNQLSLLSFSIISIVIMIYLVSVHALQNIFISNLILQKEKLDKEKLESLVQIRTNELRSANKSLIKEATTDSLTGLINRSHFIHLTENSIKTVDEFSILLIDINHFKLINDVHGHNMGDYVLKTVASRLSETSSSACFCARTGGDGFAVLIRTSKPSRLEALATHIIQSIHEPIIYEKYNFHIDISIGIASYPKDAKDAVKLMTCADISLHQCKSTTTTDRCILYSLHLTEKINRKNHITLLLKEADLLNDFELYYQPKFTADTEKLIGMEALIRWNHKTEGFISPAEFIPISEETGIIMNLSTWIFETAMSQINRWNRAYSTNLIMSINLSPLSFNCSSFILDIRTLLNSTNVSPDWVEFEITEHSAMNSATHIEESLTSLRNLGVGLSIDDFGTGYSSLAYLKRFNVNVIKIAKELIDTIDNSKEDNLIVNAIILMAKGLGLDTIAEGVETEEQLELLKELKCDSIQGYLLGRPMPADKFENIIHSD